MQVVLSENNCFRYLDLLTEEHATIKRERHLMEEFEQAETAEREAFQALSARVRKSHEKERERFAVFIPLFDMRIPKMLRMGNGMP